MSVVEGFHFVYTYGLTSHFACFRTHSIYIDPCAIVHVHGMELMSAHSHIALVKTLTTACVKKSAPCSGLLHYEASKYTVSMSLQLAAEESFQQDVGREHVVYPYILYFCGEETSNNISDQQIRSICTTYT